jgi:5-formyltetrahydrofolate cyclo-ligase
MNERKRALRSELVAARARLSTDDRAVRSAAVAARVEELPGFLQARVVALYAPLGAEVDPSSLALRAAARGVKLAYPRAVAGSRRLAFALAAPGGLVPGPLGALEPPPSAPEVPLASIDAVVVPCVAFTAEGLRLGRGGGYYDATLPALPLALRVGVGFEPQLVAELPREAHDALLDAVVTEARTLLFPREARPPRSPPTP